MLIIGLTGGIGSGKSTVCRMFAARGVPVIDADIVGRELVAPGRPALEEIVHHFGADILDSTGNLDRARLRAIVFSDPEKRRLLESILHPAIREEMWARARRESAPYCVLCIPLLIETGQQAQVDRVLVVDCNEAVQIGRIRDRDNIGEELARTMMHAQIPRQDRLAHADDIIRNEDGLDALEAQVRRLHESYLALSDARR